MTALGERGIGMVGTSSGALVGRLTSARPTPYAPSRFKRIRNGIVLGAASLLAASGAFLFVVGVAPSEAPPPAALSITDLPVHYDGRLVSWAEISRLRDLGLADHVKVVDATAFAYDSLDELRGQHAPCQTCRH